MHLYGSGDVVKASERAVSGMSGWLLLANAIVGQAAKDYREALRKERRKEIQDDEDKRLMNLRNKTQLERFFRSEYFSLLSDCSGEWIMEHIEEEYL